MQKYRGVVRGGVIELPKDVHLREGMEVEVQVPQPEDDVQSAFERVRKNRIRHFVGIDEIIEEDKREREEHWEKRAGQ